MRRLVRFRFCDNDFRRQALLAGELFVEYLPNNKGAREHIYDTLDLGTLKNSLLKVLLNLYDSHILFIDTLPYTTERSDKSSVELYLSGICEISKVEEVEDDNLESLIIDFDSVIAYLT